MVITSRTRNAVVRKLAQGFESLSLRQQNGQTLLFVRFVFRYLIKGIRTRALRKRHSASFLAADRRLLQSIKIANQGCFAKGKNESLSYALNRDSARCVASCCLRREPLRRKADAPLLRVNSPASLLHEPFLSAIKKQRNSYLLLHKASYIDSVAYKTVKVGDKIYIPNN